MFTPGTEERIGKFLAPRALFAGIAAGFLACCAAGFIASRHNQFAQFERFHQLISPESLFYPTACEVRALARARLDKDRVAVVIGGNSIMHGVGQRAPELWSKRLQELLGDDYRVLNVAMRAALPNEFGMAAAEMATRQHPRVIFITDIATAGLPGEADGNLYRYFLWDAYSKGLLPRDPVREARLRDLARQRREDERFAELRREMAVDRLTYSRDLWTALAYRRLCTVWTLMTRSAFTRPRRGFLDPDPGELVPSSQRYAPAFQEVSMTILRGWIDRGRSFGLAPADAAGRSCFEAAVKPSVPASLRGRTLFLVVHDNPYYVDQLAPVERAEYRASFAGAAQALREMGFAAVEIGRDYTVEEFYDRCHIGEAGGRRMANDVAPAVRQMARQLGYLKEGESP
jgi:hypothetical protein